MKAIKYIIPFFILLFGVTSIKAQDLPDRPTPPRLVVDYTGTLSANEVRALENKLVHFNDTSSNQILVILTNDLAGYDIEQYASGIGDKWGVGQREFDNGVVVVIKPKVGNDRGDAFISVGYGLGGAIPDFTAGQIVDYEMIPYFKQYDYYGGLDAGTTVLMELAAGEYSSDEYTGSKSAGWFAYIPFIIFIIIFILINRAAKTCRHGPLSGSALWWAAAAEAGVAHPAEDLVVVAEAVALAASAVVASAVVVPVEAGNYLTYLEPL